MLTTRYVATALVAMAMTAGFSATADAAWKGKAELGALQTSGNSDTSSINASFGLTHTAGAWENAFSAAAFSAEEDDVQSAERYAATFKSSYDFSEYNYLFVNLTYDKDLFGGVRERATETIGYGRRLIDNERQMLNLELGAGARQQETQKPESLESDDVITRGALLYNYNLSETASFSQKFLVESGEENTYSESVTGLKLTVVGPTFAGITYTVKHNSDVAVGTEKTDTYLSLSLSYEFGSSE